SGIAAESAHPAKSSRKARVPAGSPHRIVAGAHVYVALRARSQNDFEISLRVGVDRLNEPHSAVESHGNRFGDGLACIHNYSALDIKRSLHSRVRGLTGSHR